MLSPARSKRTIFAFLALLLVLSLFSASRTNLRDKIPNIGNPDKDAPPPKPLYKPDPPPPPEIKDNFPLAAGAKSPKDLPPIPQWNRPPSTHVKEETPLFIGFTRNWRLLQQVVVSYITAGWPPGDIYVVENTGVMHSNKDGKLTIQNPFFLDHHRLTKILGINVLITPTLLTFAQLQNFFTYTAVEKAWPQYFWAHMDAPIVSDEEFEPDGHEKETSSPFQSAYARAVEVLRASMAPTYGTPAGPLAARWFAYDRLSLVRTQSFVDAGGWDTLIPFYMTDCDMHERLWMKNFTIEGAAAGKIWDVDTALEDLEILYLRGEGDDPSPDNKNKDPPAKNSWRYKDILHRLDDMQRAKGDRAEGRNTWQSRQKGGQGEPFYRDSDGFEKGIQMTMDLGRDVYYEKWGRGPCNLREVGLKDGDQWRLVKDWETGEAQRLRWKEEEEERKKKEKQGESS
ncbi:MAG: hypothetical protein Q9191_003909 [Dirinaria sp. TL-2023a]